MESICIKVEGRYSDYMDFTVSSDDQSLYRYEAATEKMRMVDMLTDEQLAKWGMVYTLAAYREFCERNELVESSATMSMYIEWHEMNLSPQKISDLWGYMEVKEAK